MPKLRSLSANSCRRSRPQSLEPRECFAIGFWTRKVNRTGMYWKRTPEVHFRFQNRFQVRCYPCLNYARSTTKLDSSNSPRHLGPNTLCNLEGEEDERAAKL